MEKVDQIFRGLVVEDYDEILSNKQILEITSKLLKIKNSTNPYIVNIDGINVSLYIKNISYLGHPHPHFKKRIQIPLNWKKGLLNENSFLFGIYSYKGTTIYTCFDKYTYLQRNINNSSAHISTNDLLQGIKEGVYEKRDANGNTITIISSQNLKSFLRLKIQAINTLTPEIALLKNFNNNNIVPKWLGIDCYKEMINAQYSNALQAEWPGFYFEFIFQKFLNFDEKNLLVCKFLNNKKNNEIDLDLFFNRTKHFGDLKTHDINSSEIIGNDKVSLLESIKLNKRLWYVVLNIVSKKDKDFNYITTEFWNGCLKKKNSLSYSKRMKHSCNILSLEVLEINNYNLKYLKEFNQGKNSNGTPRAVKFSIPNKMKENFSIYTFAPL